MRALFFKTIPYLELCVNNKKKFDACALGCGTK